MNSSNLAALVNETDKTTNDFQRFVRDNYRAIADTIKLDIGEKNQPGAVMKEVSRQWHLQNGSKPKPQATLRQQLMGTADKSVARKKRDPWQGLTVKTVNKYIRSAGLKDAVGNMKTATKKDKIELVKQHVRFHAK